MKPQDHIQKKSNIHLGTITEIIDLEKHIVGVSIPNYGGSNMAAYPIRENDEPQIGDNVILFTIDPILGTSFRYAILREDNFTGIRRGDSTLDINGNQILLNSGEGANIQVSDKVLIDNGQNLYSLLETGFNITKSLAESVNSLINAINGGTPVPMDGGLSLHSTIIRMITTLPREIIGHINDINGVVRNLNMLLSNTVAEDGSETTPDTVVDTPEPMMDLVAPTIPPTSVQPDFRTLFMQLRDLAIATPDTQSTALSAFNITFNTSFPTT